MLAVALCIGLYLLWLWRPEHQVRLHTEHFFHAIDGRNWESVADFIGEDYRDQWDQDRARLLERMREGFRWVRGSTITAPDAAVRVETPRAIWIGKINVYSSDDGVMQLLDERVNRLPTPFEEPAKGQDCPDPSRPSFLDATSVNRRVRTPVLRLADGNPPFEIIPCYYNLGRAELEGLPFGIKAKARRNARGADIERLDEHKTRIRRFGNSVCEAFGIGA